MRLQLPQKIDKNQWLQRLGVRGEPDVMLEQQMEMAERELMNAAVPAGIYRLLPVDAFDLPGNAIKKHLADCDCMVVMAVTLGAGVDRLIRTSQVRDMAQAVILDAGASVLVEQMADALELLIHAETGDFMPEAAGASDNAPSGLTHFTGRYSPGYGDFPIEMQSMLIKAVDGPKTIGLTVNESHILIPRKSITAVVGVSDQPVKGYLATCDECKIKDNCRLREEGRTCYA